MQYQEDLLKAQPSLAGQISKANNFLNTYRPEIMMSGAGYSPDMAVPVITIPVVVHVLYKDASQNISDEQVLSQIDVLNKAFSLQSADTARIPAYFRGIAANCRIQFCLAKVDPKGRATNGIVRVSTWVTMYGIDDRIKFSNQGGDDAWDADRYFNIWVGNLAGGMVGYSSVIGGPKERDGIAVKPTAFGTKGTASAPYHLGKTVVHETGHWLGLRHIWGDATCGDDLVDDTPRQRTSNRGCPSGIKPGCDNTPYGENYQNYMDLTSDECMLMFTVGQMNRMRASFAPGGAHYNILSSNGCTGTPLPVGAAAPVTEEKVVVKLISVYPNPVQSRLVIDILENNELLGADVQVVNQFGQVVKGVKITQVKTIVNIGYLPSGMYVVKVGNWQEKIIKN